jgi:monothiol glutaredoxin
MTPISIANALALGIESHDFQGGEHSGAGRSDRKACSCNTLPATTSRRTAMGIEQFIDSEVKANDIVLFMKGTPQFPMCGFSGQVVQILDHLGVSYKGLNVLDSDDLRNGIKSYSNWPTIPQLYVKGEFVGGCDIIREMFQAGELQALMKEKGLPVKETQA